MGKCKSHGQFVKEVDEILGADYILLSKYMNQKIKIKHITCNTSYEVFPNRVLQGGRCPKCFGRESMIKTSKQFKQEVFNLVDDEYKVLGEYTRCHTKILMKHRCGYEFLMERISFIRGTRCPKCDKIRRAEQRRKSHKQFEKEFYELAKNEYTLISEYTDSETKILIKHKTCGYDYMVKPGNFINNGRRCPICAKKSCGAYRKLSRETYINRMLEATGNEYTLIGEYINTTTKVRIKHNVCGREWEITPKNYFSGRRCPICNISNGENAILRVLEKYSINYQREKEFDSLLSFRGKHLRFDYAVYNDNNLFLLIEYQGEFHDGSISNHFQLHQDLEAQQENDRRKKEYVIDNNVNFLEIWYFDFNNIEEILFKYLKNIIVNG